MVSMYWKKLATEVEDETKMKRMLYDDMMLLQVLKISFSIKSTSGLQKI